jgi:murein L,D-transpeptidase YcbB/YkuD
LVLLASHEAANPEIGNTNIEFYSAQFKQEFLTFECDPDQNNPESLREQRLTEQFYLSRNYLPAWTTNFETSNQYSELIGLLRTAYSYGLLPLNYNLKQLRSLENVLGSEKQGEVKMQARVKFEYYTTRATLRFMMHISSGIHSTDTSKTYVRYISNLPNLLNRFINENNVRLGILSLQPDDDQYILLQKALSKYMAKALKDTASYTPEKLSGNREFLVQCLINQGYLDESFKNDSMAVHSALRNLQRMYNLEINGELNKNTLEVLSKSTDEKFFKIALNLDRIRKDKLAYRNAILVNIPEFRLRYYDAKGKKSGFNVVVGKEESPTPEITSYMEEIIANPYWTVPQSITRNEILPRLKRDTTYLQRNGFNLVDRYNNPVNIDSIDWRTVNPNEFNYWFRQNNRNNALGVVTFLFPNEHAVYLHDTQSKRLFKKRMRAYSHGCIRVENPVELAQLILNENTEYDQYVTIEKAIRSKEKTEFKIHHSLTVQIRYYTCTADSLGNIFFHPDVYARDDKAIQALFAHRN